MPLIEIFSRLEFFTKEVSDSEDFFSLFSLFNKKLSPGNFFLGM